MPDWYLYAQIASKTAALLGKERDARKYTAMAEDIKLRFNKKYYHEKTGLYGDSTNSQTGQVLPLAVGLVPDGKTALTYQRLIEAIHLRDDHVGTGFTSLSYLLKLLAFRRESAIANRMINQKDYPSWNTLMGGGVFEETWHGDGAQMPSCGGAVGAWLFQSVLGIQPDEAHPGFKEFVISPQPDNATGLTAAKGYYDTGYGRISVDWHCEGGKFFMDLEVPANSSSKVYIPADKGSAVLESGKPVKNESTADGIAELYITSGKYHFETAFSL
jgi:alpha-L-rhamnosidase